MYGKLIEGVLEYAPETFKERNKTIFNFNLSEKLMKKYGYKKVINIVPEVGLNQSPNVSGYSEDETSITVNYEVVDIKPYMNPYESIFKEEVNK